MGPSRRKGQEIKPRVHANERGLSKRNNNRKIFADLHWIRVNPRPVSRWINTLTNSSRYLPYASKCPGWCRPGL